MDKVRGTFETGRWTLALFQGATDWKSVVPLRTPVGCRGLGISASRQSHSSHTSHASHNIPAGRGRGSWQVGNRPMDVGLIPGPTDWKSVVLLRGPVGCRGLGISASYRSHPSHASHNIPAGRGRGSWQVRNRPMDVGLIPGGDGLEVRRTATGTGWVAWTWDFRFLSVPSVPCVP